MFLARIITKYKKIDTYDFIEVTNDYSKIDDILPTLIIGKKNAIEIYGANKVKVLNKNITDNVSWCYAKTEKRDEFDLSLKNFNKGIIDKISKDVKYCYFSIFRMPLSTTKRCISFIKDKTKEKNIYVDEDMLYVQYKDKVMGFSIVDAKYCKISPNKIYSIIYSNNNNHIIYSKDIPYSIKKMLKNCIYLIPYIKSINKQGL